ncbi:hypothetical protein [Candidatus Endomicrobiellum pyrsonymphae]|uniref:hypothetical protein n=1 Tax=Candidatus Endomicrobiellum pyrsonymphae TaxID=1408203 RepID=UPI0035A8FAC2
MAVGTVAALGTFAVAVWWKKHSTADNGKDGKKEKGEDKEDNPERPSTPVVVLTAEETESVVQAAGKGEEWALREAEFKLCRNNGIVYIRSESSVLQAGKDAIARERRETKKKLIAVVVNAEKELTKTGVDKVRQAGKDVMKKMTYRQHLSSELAAREMRKVMGVPDNIFLDPYEADDSYLLSLMSAKSSIWNALDPDMGKRMEKNMNAQLLGTDWETQVRQEAAETGDRKRDKTLLLSAGTHEWVTWKIEAEKKPIGLKLKDVMMGVKELAFEAMNEKWDAENKK